MQKFAAALLATTLALAAAPAFAQSEAEMRASIEEMHGDADGFFDLYSALQNAAEQNDPAAIADRVLYPLRVNADGGSHEVPDAKAFADDFDTILPAETRDALKAEDPTDFIVTSEGVGLVNGAIWLTNICLDDACEQTQWSILSIND